MALLEDIRSHLAVANEDQRKRRGAVLLREAAAEIERLRAITPSESDSPQAIGRTLAQASTPGEGTRESECPYVTGTVTRYCTLTPFTLTDAERFVLCEVRDAYADRDEVKANEIAAVIDCLLERTSNKGTA
jgi:hypothetical protein